MLKQQQAKLHIQEELAKLAPGIALPPVRELMMTYQLSQRTIMHAIAELADEGLIERRAKSGIYACEESHRRDVVAYLTCYPMSRTSTRVLQGIQSALRDAHRALYLATLEKGHYDESEAMLEKNHIGEIIIQPSSQHIDDLGFIQFIQRLIHKGRRIVVVDLPIPGIPTPFVGEANSNAFQSMAELFAERDCRRIVVAGKFGSRIYAARLEGITTGIQGRGIELIQVATDGTRNRTKLAKQIVKEASDKNIILTDASCSSELAYELQLQIPHNEMGKYMIGGVIEPGGVWPLPVKNTVWLEKQSEEMGVQAAKLLNDRSEIPSVKLLPMTQKGLIKR